MKKILIAEHDADMIRYLNLVAARFGFNAFVAETAAAAEAALDQESFAFAIVSKSLYGRDFKKRLGRFADKLGGSNVVVVCGDDFEETARVSTAQGVRACLTTPFEVVFIPDLLDEAATPAQGGTEPEDAPEGASAPEEDDLP